MKNINAIHVMVKGACKCCGTPFQEIVAVGSYDEPSAAVKEIIKSTPPRAAKSSDCLIRDLIAIVASATNQDPRAIKGDSRKAETALARHLLAWIVRRHLGYSWIRVAEIVGYRDHTSASHAVNKIQSMLDMFGIYNIGEDWFNCEPGKPKEMNASKLMQDVSSLYAVLAA